MDYFLETFKVNQKKLDMDVLMLFLSNLIGNNKKYWKFTKLTHITGNFAANVMHLYCRSLKIESC